MKELHIDICLYSSVQLLQYEFKVLVPLECLEPMWP